MNISTDKKLASVITEFDGLRGVAIICVLLVHTISHYWAQWTGARFVLGQLGVPLFFAISGFCISYGILKRTAAGKTASSVDFAKRRWRRIYPPYVLAMFITFAKNLVVGHPAMPARQIPAVLFHNLTLTQVLAPSLPEINPAYWSLCVEFQFYLVFGVWIALMEFGWKRWSSVYCFLLLGASLGFIYVQEHVTPLIPEHSWFMSFPRSAPLFFFGAAVAWLKIRLADGGAVRRVHWLILAGITCSLGLGVGLGWVIALLIAAAGLAKQLGISSMPSKIMNWHPLMYLGERSYSIYLIHGLGVAVLSEYGAKLMAHHFALSMAVLAGTWVFCIGTGLIYFHFVERHFLRSAPVI